MMQTDIKAVACPTATNTSVYGSRGRIRALTITATTGATQISIYDSNQPTGTATGSIAGNLSWAFVPHTTGNPIHVEVPAEGILCQNGILASVPANVTMTVYYS